LITLMMSVVIDSEPQRVWRALTEPDEVVAWDERMLSAVGEPNGYPFAGQHVRWRYRLGSVPVVLHERPREISPTQRLSSSFSVGSLHFEQTYTLSEEQGDPPRTRLGMKVVAMSQVPVMGDVIDRFGVRKLTAERIDETLRSIKRWCQEHP
jgi:uncharacterized protein YndB with AHSA1/START domain